MIGKYLIFVPEVRGNPGEEWSQYLKQIINKRETDFRLIKLNIFTNLPDYRAYLKANTEIGEALHKAFGKQCPVFNVTAHPPEKPWKVAVEAGYTDAASSNIDKWTTIKLYES